MSLTVDLGSISLLRTSKPLLFIITSLQPVGNMVHVLKTHRIANTKLGLRGSHSLYLPDLNAGPNLRELGGILLAMHFIPLIYYVATRLHLFQDRRLLTRSFSHSLTDAREWVDAIRR